ncbi:hypothetical protein JL09_g7021 [Pichia kudriavzevii]|nr:hypothetical protein JL09_g7023 [Pichia kudriavzevii]KGK32372.1 hypothetical protein JL09_g7021 [Pichia kudriavzevii]
MQSPQSY